MPSHEGDRYLDDIPSRNEHEVRHGHLFLTLLKLLSCNDHILAISLRGDYGLFLCVKPTLCIARRIVERCTRLERYTRL